MGVTNTVKELRADIARYKKAIIAEVKASGITENLGQNYVRELKDKYHPYSYGMDDRTAIMNCITAFDNWCMDFDLSQI